MAGVRYEISALIDIGGLFGFSVILKKPQYRSLDGNVVRLTRAQGECVVLSIHKVHTQPMRKCHEE